LPCCQEVSARKPTHYVAAPTIQNQLLQLLAQYVTAQILDKVRASKYYALSVDECQDLSNHSQVAIVLKYATDKLVEVESFFGFLDFSGLRHDGQSLS